LSNRSDRIGQVINERYELLDIIGIGGQGIVYRAFDRWLGRAVAIKVLGSNEARLPHVAERLIREQQALSALKGTAAVEVFDICRGNTGELCLVMEFLSGASLEDYLRSLDERNERLELARVVEIFEPIVETLEVAHGAGILHRDLKPANVFLVEGGGVRLLDFGLARLRSAAPLTAAGTIMGSPSFMAPEAWMGLSELIDNRADAYSLGVMLFRVLAGALPFEGESLQEKFMGSTTGSRPSLFVSRPDLPREADEWVVLALAINPDERFASVRAMWAAFLTTFGLERVVRKPSLWAAAKNAVSRLAGVAEKVPAAQALPVLDSRVPSSREPPPLPRGAPPPLPRDSASAVEPTVELCDLDFIDATPAPRRVRSPEKTIEVSIADLLGAPPRGAQAPEKTIEVSVTDLLARPPSRVQSPERTIEVSVADLLAEPHAVPGVPGPQVVAKPERARARKPERKRSRTRKRKQRRR
jgi:serine/threonine protein kinase